MAYIAKNNKNLILIRGVSGSGKSTFAEEFLYPTSLIISTDDFFMVDGEYQVQEIEPYKELADKYGYNFYTIIVENRHKSNSIHNVPDYVISKQRERFSVVL